MHTLHLHWFLGFIYPVYNSIEYLVLQSGNSAPPNTPLGLSCQISVLTACAAANYVTICAIIVRLMFTRGAKYTWHNSGKQSLE